MKCSKLLLLALVLLIATSTSTDAKKKKKVSLATLSYVTIKLNLAACTAKIFIPFKFTRLWM